MNFLQSIVQNINSLQNSELKTFVSNAFSGTVAATAALVLVRCAPPVLSFASERAPKTPQGWIQLTSSVIVAGAVMRQFSHQLAQGLRSFAEKYQLFKDPKVEEQADRLLNQTAEQVQQFGNAIGSPEFQARVNKALGQISPLAATVGAAAVGALASPLISHCALPFFSHLGALSFPEPFTRSIFGMQTPLLIQAMRGKPSGPYPLENYDGSAVQMGVVAGLVANLAHRTAPYFPWVSIPLLSGCVSGFSAVQAPNCLEKYQPTFAQ